MTNTNKKVYPTFIDFKKGQDNPFGVVIANTTRDVELRHTQSGKAVAGVAIATNLAAQHLNYVLGTSFEKDAIIFIEVSAWEKTGELLAKVNIPKGSQVAFTGYLSIEEYEGKKRVRLNVSRFNVTRWNGERKEVSGDQKKGTIIDVNDEDLPF